MSLVPLTKTTIPMRRTIRAVKQWNKFQWLTQWAKFSSTTVDASSCIVSIPSFCVVFLNVHLKCLLSNNVEIIHYFNAVSVLFRDGPTTDIYGFVKWIPAISFPMPFFGAIPTVWREKNSTPTKKQKAKINVNFNIGQYEMKPTILFSYEKLCTKLS